MTNSVDPDQTAPIGAVCSGSTLFAAILYSSVMLGNYLQQTTSADDIFIFPGALRVNIFPNQLPSWEKLCYIKHDNTFIKKVKTILTEAID